MSPQRLSLAQQIAELLDPAPVDFVPEDEQEQRCSPDLLERAVQARDHYIEVGPSTFHRHIDSVVDPKYVGTKASRKQLEEDNSLGSAFVDLPGQDGSTSQVAPSEGSSGEEEERGLSLGKEGDASEHEKSTPRNSQGIQESSSYEKDLSTLVRQRRDEDRKKGKAVIKQLGLWDSLLDARIRLQKSVAASNRLPSPTEISELTSQPRCLEACHAMLGETLALVEELSALREELIKEDKEVQWQPRKRRRVQDGSEQGRRSAPPEIDNVDRDWDALIKEASEDAAGLEHAYHIHLMRTLEKWSAKVAAVAPSGLLPASRKRFSLAGSTQGVESLSTQIEDILQNEWPALLSRTRLKRCKGPRVTGEEGGDNGFDEDEEVFDDTDFYQQLLRDVIDSKGGGSVRLMDWVGNQKQKKNVDTRASKGRKLRYEVHEKIQNFMAPVPLRAGGWHEAQLDELFGSLLGKGFTVVE